MEVLKQIINELEDSKLTATMCLDGYQMAENDGIQRAISLIEPQIIEYNKWLTGVLKQLEELKAENDSLAKICNNQAKGIISQHKDISNRDEKLGILERENPKLKQQLKEANERVEELEKEKAEKKDYLFPRKNI